MRRRTRRVDPAVSVGLVALGAVTAAGLAIAMRRGLLGRGARGAPPPPPRFTWSCACGQAYRSVGLGRHQVHWLAEAPEEEPVLGDACPTCGRPLPVIAG